MGAMVIRKIAQIGHPVLRAPTEEVSPEQLRSPAFQSFIDDLIETMRDANGAGLAANQIYQSVRVCALEVGDNPRYPYKPKIPLTILVNPKVEFLTEDTFNNYEGCLSVPNLRGLVKRRAEIRLTALDREGQPIDQVFKGFAAGTVQHEVDHLFGHLFVDWVEDPKSLATWAEFERFHKAEFMEEVERVVARYHSRNN